MPTTVFLAMTAVLAAADAPMRVSRWGRFECVITNDTRYANPFADVELKAAFTSPSGRAVSFFGFYDGDGKGGQAGNVWRLRFMPDEMGPWSYEAKFSDGSGSTAGRFECVAGDLHGPIQVNRENPHWFQHADGTPFFLNAMKYIFVERLGAAGRARLIEVLRRRHRFTAIMGPHVKASDKNAGGNFDPWVCDPYWTGSGHDFDRTNLRFWQRMDEVLEDLGRAGMILIPFGMVGGTNSDMVPLPPKAEQRVRFARYWTARWAAYWNATFQPQSEYEESTILKDGGAEEICRIIAETDPWGHLISVHSTGVATPFARSDWFCYYTVQGSQPNNRDRGYEYNAQALRLHGLAPKPVFFHECIWEASGYSTHTGSDPNVIRRSAWQMVMGGGSPCYSDQVLPVHWSRLVPNVHKEPLGRTYAFLDILYDFITARPYQRMRPRNDLLSGATAPGITCLAEVGDEYVVFFHAGGRVTLDLRAGADRIFTSNWFDPRTAAMRAAETGLLSGDKRVTVQAPDQGDWVLWLSRRGAKGEPAPLAGRKE